MSEMSLFCRFQSAFETSGQPVDTRQDIYSGRNLNLLDLSGDIPILTIEKAGLRSI